MFNDERGKLFFPIKRKNFYVSESTVSINHKNVFRGIHVEQFYKLVTCIQGRILDIVINFDEKSTDYLVTKYNLLDSNTDNNQLLIFPNHGHAFLSLDDNSIVLYHFSHEYKPENSVTYNYMDPIFNIKLPIDNPIISQKDKDSPFFKNLTSPSSPSSPSNSSVFDSRVSRLSSVCDSTSPSEFRRSASSATTPLLKTPITPIDFYILGGNGFIGSVIMDSIQTLESKTKEFVYKTSLRLEQVEQIEKELDLYKPKYVICSAGITGTPNISWCEDHKTETIETNITYQMTLAHLCKKKNIHLTIIGSGVIFKNDKYYTEEDEGNYDENFYSKCRIQLENMIRNYDNVLYTRINYPISKHNSTKNLITKLLSYSYIDNVNITLTYIDELIPILLDMIKNNETGICNLVNEGEINLMDIMRIYKTLSIPLSTPQQVCEFSVSATSSTPPLLKINNEKINKSTSLLKLGKLKKYNVMDVNSAVYECIKNYIL